MISAIPGVVIRAAVKSDSHEIARLFAALGHPTSAETLAVRWDEWAAAGNLALVAASEDGVLAGVATLHRMLVLHRPKLVGRITALIVDDARRRRGIGRALVTAAEGVLARAGCGLLEITRHARLADAHTFYERLGYARTSVRFAKDLAQAES